MLNQNIAIENPCNALDIYTLRALRKTYKMVTIALV